MCEKYRPVLQSKPAFIRACPFRGYPLYLQACPPSEPCCFHGCPLYLKCLRFPLGSRVPHDSMAAPQPRLLCSASWSYRTADCATLVVHVFATTARWGSIYLTVVWVKHVMNICWRSQCPGWRFCLGVDLRNERPRTGILRNVDIGAMLKTQGVIIIPQEKYYLPQYSVVIIHFLRL